MIITKQKINVLGCLFAEQRTNSIRVRRKGRSVKI